MKLKIVLAVLCVSLVAQAKDKPCKLTDSWSFKSACGVIVPSDCASTMVRVKDIAASRFYQASAAESALYIAARPNATHKLMMGIWAPERRIVIRFEPTAGGCYLSGTGSGSLATDVLKRLPAKPFVPKPQQVSNKQQERPSADPNADSALDRSGRAKQ